MSRPNGRFIGAFLADVSSSLSNGTGGSGCKRKWNMSRPLGLWGRATVPDTQPQSLSQSNGKPVGRSEFNEISYTLARFSNRHVMLVGRLGKCSANLVSKQ